MFLVWVGLSSYEFAHRSLSIFGLYGIPHYTPWTKWPSSQQSGAASLSAQSCFLPFMSPQVLIPAALANFLHSNPFQNLFSREPNNHIPGSYPQRVLCRSRVVWGHMIGILPNSLGNFDTDGPHITFWETLSFKDWFDCLLFTLLVTEESPALSIARWPAQDTRLQTDKIKLIVLEEDLVCHTGLQRGPLRHTANKQGLWSDPWSLWKDVTDLFE